MTTIFMSGPFQRLAFSPSHVSPFLGVDPDYTYGDVGPTPDDDTSGIDFSGIMSSIQGLLKQVPAQVFGTYSTEFKRCQSLLSDGGLLSTGFGSHCLYQLYADLQEETAPVARPPGYVPPPPPRESAFPIIPVAIGGAALLGLILASILIRK